MTPRTSPANELTVQILKFLYEHGAFGWRQATVGTPTGIPGVLRPAAKKGVSDILAVIPPQGRLLAVEVKIDKDRLSPEQEGFLLNVANVGGLTFVAKDFESFVQWWNEHFSPSIPCGVSRRP